MGLCKLCCQKGFQENYCLWFKSLLFLPYITETIKNLLWFASLWFLWNWHVMFSVARERTHFLRIRPIASFLWTQPVYSRPLYFILTGGRLYTGYLDWNILCKPDGESVMAIIESSKNGCTVRKLNNFSIFLLVFSRKKVYTFYPCGNFIISKVGTEVNWT